MLVTAGPISQLSPVLGAYHDSTVREGHYYEDEIEALHYATDARPHKTRHNPQMASLTEPNEAGPVPQIFITGHFLWTKRKTVYATPTASPALISLLLSSRAQGVLFVCTVVSFTSQHFNLHHTFSLQYIFNLALVAAFHSDREWREGFICQGYGRMRHPTFSRNEDGALCFTFIVQPSLQSGHMPRKRLPKLKSLDHCTF